MPTQLLNKSVEQVLSLPYPYAGCVAPGESAILREDSATVAALFGTLFARMPISLITLRASEVRETDYAPYDPVVRLTSSDTGYVLKPWQRIVSADTSGGAITVYGPSAADLVGYAPGHYEILVLDATSSFATHAFTLNGNGYLINGAATLVLSTVNQAALVGWRGGSYIILSAAAGASGVAPHASTHRAGSSDPIYFSTIGPNSGQQHTVPAVASGTVIVSGASSMTDDTLQVGDATHRLSAIGLRQISSGANALLIDCSQADGATAWQVRLQRTVAMVTGGGCILRLETAAQETASDVGVLQLGCPSLGQADALCYGEWIMASGAVTAGQVVVHSGAKLVAAAGASAGLTTIAGVALTSGTNVSVLVAKRGRVYTNADAGSTVGQLLQTSGAVAGNVVNGGTAVGSIVGRACESTGGTVAGKILVDLTLS